MASNPAVSEALAIASEQAQIVADRVRLAGMADVTNDPVALATNEHAAVCWETYANLLKDAADGAR